VSHGFSAQPAGSVTYAGPVRPAGSVSAVHCGASVDPAGPVTPVRSVAPAPSAGSVASVIHGTCGPRGCPAKHGRSVSHGYSAQPASSVTSAGPVGPAGSVTTADRGTFVICVGCVVSVPAGISRVRSASTGRPGRRRPTVPRPVCLPGNAGERFRPAPRKSRRLRASREFRNRAGCRRRRPTPWGSGDRRSGPAGRVAARRVPAPPPSHRRAEDSRAPPWPTPGGSVSSVRYGCYGSC